MIKRAVKIFTALGLHNFEINIHLSSLAVAKPSP